MGFLKGQKAGETEGICRKLLNILQSKEGWRGEVNKNLAGAGKWDTGGRWFGSPCPPTPYPFLTIKSETWIKNGECGNLTTGKRIKEEGKKVMAVKVKVSQLLLVREFMRVVIWGFWQYFFLHHLDKRINCCPTCSIWWKGVGWYATSKCILLMGQAVTFIGGGGESLIPHELVGFSEISPPQPLLPSCILILI